MEDECSYYVERGDNFRSSREAAHYTDKNAVTWLPSLDQI